MSVSLQRARRSWLMTFGDVITLLLTFFIMMIVLHKGETTKLQTWADSQVDETFEQLQQFIVKENLQVLTLNRTAQGILVTINHSNAFKSGDYQPTEQLQSEIGLMGGLLKSAPLLGLEKDSTDLLVLEQAKKSDLQWLIEVNVAGHTDSDHVDTHSRLRNNWFLSTLRAQTVMKLLYESSGLPAELFSVDGYGEYQPIASNSSKEDKAQNRRVEVLISASFQKIQS